MPRATPVSGPHEVEKHPALSGGHVMFVSGENPDYPQSATHSGSTALQQLLDQDGLDYEPTRGKYGKKSEGSFIVHVRDLDQIDRVKKIARLMGQEAVVHSRGGQHQLVYVNGPNEGMATAPSSGYKFYQQEPEDDYTMIPGASGQPLGFFSYRFDFNKPLQPHGYVEAPQVAKSVLDAVVDHYKDILLDLRFRELAKAGDARPDTKLGKYSFDAGSAGSSMGGGLALGEESSEKTELSPGSGGVSLSEETGVEKYEAKYGEKVRGQPLHHDISAQGGNARPSHPYPHNIAMGGSIKDPKTKTAKTEEGEKGEREQIRRVFEREHRELANIPWADPDKPRTKQQSGVVLSIAERRAREGRAANKTEKPMKLHDLMKSQAKSGLARLPAGRWSGKAEESMSKMSPQETSNPAPDAPAAHPEPVGKAEPLSKPPVSQAQRAAMHAAKEGRSTLGIPKKVGKEFVEGDPGGKLPKYKKAVSEWGKDKQSYHPKAFPGEKPEAHAQITLPKPKPPHEEQSMGPVKKQMMGTSMAPPVPQGPYSRGMAMSDKEAARKVVRPIKSVFKRSQMEKDEFKPTRRYSIKLGKAEFFIDLKNANDSKKRVRDVNPVPDTKVPGGPETGWDSNAPKCQKVDQASEKERGTSSIGRANAPKSGPDQKNDSAPIITEEASKSKPGQQHGVTATGPNKNAVRQSKENTSIIKGEGDYGHEEEYEHSDARECPACGGEGGHMGNLGARKHYNCRNCGMWFSHRPSEEKEVKKADSMAAPKPPKAPGSGAPKLSGAAPTKPSTAMPSAMGKAIGEPDLRGGRAPVPAGTTPPSPASGATKPATGVRGTPIGHFGGLPKGGFGGSPKGGFGGMSGGIKSPAFAKNIRGFSKKEHSIHGVPMSEGSGSPETSRMTKKGVPMSEGSRSTSAKISSEGSGSPETSKMTKGAIPVSEGSGKPEHSVSSEGSGSPETSKMTKAEFCKMCKKVHVPGAC